MLVQHTRYGQVTDPTEGWTLIWEGKRPADRHEYFKLYKKLK
jgi:hypothetical protein